MSTCWGDSLPAGLSLWISPFFFFHVPLTSFSFSACRGKKKQKKTQQIFKIVVDDLLHSRNETYELFVYTCHLNDNFFSKVSVSVTFSVCHSFSITSCRKYQKRNLRSNLSCKLLFVCSHSVISSFEYIVYWFLIVCFIFSGQGLHIFLFILACVTKKSRTDFTWLSILWVFIVSLTFAYCNYLTSCGLYGEDVVNTGGGGSIIMMFTCPFIYIIIFYLTFFSTSSCLSKALNWKSSSILNINMLAGSHIF